MKVYARGGLRFLGKYADMQGQDGDKDHTYEAMLDTILAEHPNAKYVVIVSAGNDVYGVPAKEDLHKESYEDVQVATEIVKVAARLCWRFPRMGGAPGGLNSDHKAPKKQPGIGNVLVL